MSIEQKIAELLEESKKLQAEADDQKKVCEDDKEDDQSDKDVDADEKSVDKDMDDDQSDKKQIKEMSVNVSEDVEALVKGENLSEEFKAKAATIFEAAVITRVKQEAAKLEEQFDARLAEQVEIVKEGLVEKVDGYLNYVVESWIEDNEIALESGIKTEIVENFIVGMKGLFEQHYIDVPEERYDVLGEMEQTIKSLEEKLSESMVRSVELRKEINEMKRTSIVNDFTTDMVDTEAEKFKALVEELSFEDSNTFSTKLKTIRENYFGKKTTNVSSFVSDEPITLNEETGLSPTMKAYLKQLNSIK